jgi:hypothetical protein
MSGCLSLWLRFARQPQGIRDNDHAALSEARFVMSCASISSV